MSEQLKQAQLRIFSELPEDIRTMLLQLANVKKTVPASQMVFKPDVIASPVQILLATCRALNVEPADLRSESYKRVLSLARFVAWYLLRSNGYSTTSIGLLFKRRHSSVIYGTHTHIDLMDTNPVYRAKYWSVVNRIKSNAAKEAAVI